MLSGCTAVTDDPFGWVDPLAGTPFGITGDRPFFMYWQSWALFVGALGLGLAVGILW